MIDRHSHIGHSAYLDLKRKLQDDRLLEIKGSPTRVTVKGKVFWYDKYRLGTRLVQKYIGEDTAELRERLQQIDLLKQQEKKRAADKTRLIRVLRAEGYGSVGAQFGSLLAAFAKSGVFRLGGTLIGTLAFQLYEAELGLRMSFDQLAQTDDLDIASFERLSLVLADETTESVAGVLSEMSFDPVPSLDPIRTWRWRDTTRETLVEFLTPAFGEEGLRDLPALGVSAQALNYLNFLIADPIPAVALYRSGVLVQIPRPEAYAIHKLIVADRRREGTDSLKSHKDRSQAAFLIEALAEDRPDELAEAYEDAIGRGPKWRERIGRSLSKMPESASRLAAL